LRPRRRSGVAPVISLDKIVWSSTDIGDIPIDDRDDEAADSKATYSFMRFGEIEIGTTDVVVTSVIEVVVETVEDAASVSKSSESDKVAVAVEILTAVSVVEPVDKAMSNNEASESVEVAVASFEAVVVATYVMVEDATTSIEGDIEVSISAYEKLGRNKATPNARERERERERVKILFMFHDFTL